MATRKQRRRRAKEHRHEYVWEDAEGNELDPGEVTDTKPTKEPRASGRPGREPQPPSWRRTLKRGLIFAPVMFVVIMLLSPDLTRAQQITQAALIAAIFVPFSYFLDGMLYRSFQKRAARRGQAERRRGS